MSYRFALTPRAEADIDRLYAWISERNPDAAARWYESFRDAVERLKSNPFSCGFAFENGVLPEELRHLLFGIRKGRRYRALFVVRDETATILAVCAPGEKPLTSEELGT